MWSEQRHRRLVIAARMTPAILRVGEIALMAEREAEMLLARGGDAVELVFGNIFGEPVAAVVGEVELLRHRMPVESDRVAHVARNDFHVAAVEIHAADLRVRLGRHVDVAGRADRHVELVVGSDADELPAVRLVFWGIDR
jgi:hypothetical protein